MGKKIITQENFKEQLWKNGQGTTFELICLKENQLGHFADFDLRLSIASIKKDGPFSLFPGMERTLILLEGNGILLKGVQRKNFEIITFDGEEPMECKLQDGKCVDFNVIARKGFARVTTQHLFQWKDFEENPQWVFFYLIDEKKLIILHGDQDNTSVSKDDIGPQGLIKVSLFLS